MTTKKIKISLAIVFAFALCLPQFTNAQNNEFKYGSRFGLGESNLNFDDKTGESSKLAIGFGASSMYYFNDFVGFSADFMFTSKGGEIDDVTTRTDVVGQSTDYKYTDKYRMFYAELPIALNLRAPITENLFIRAYGGPSINLNLLAIESRTYDDASFDRDNGYLNESLDDIETTDYAFVYGLAVDIKSKSDQTMFLDFRVSNAMGPAGEIRGSEVENSYFLISTGYIF